MSSSLNCATTTAARSANMKRIKSTGNRTTELKLRGSIVRSGTRGWRMHVANLPGRPDFFFSSERVAVFVDGCFWHGCPKCGHIPKTNRPYWRKKLARNKQRDAQIKKILRSDGVRVLRLWECQLRDNPTSCLRRLFTLLTCEPTGGAEPNP
jgi:DNA mismatch endonuclease (patch repair protein)